jgi:hypothetical protein
MTEELVWALLWVGLELLGPYLASVLWRRANDQVQVAIEWTREATEIIDKQDASAAVIQAKDRRVRNIVLVVVMVLYLMIGLFAVSGIIWPGWIDPDVLRWINRALLVLGQVLLIGAAWRSVWAGEQILRILRKPTEEVK